MPGRWFSRAAVVVAVAGLSVGSGAAVALASSGTIVIDGISAPASEIGLLSVQAEATSAITGFTVDINSTSGTVLTLPSTDFARTSGGPTDGIWTVSSPILPAHLPYGSYQVVVSAQDSGGDSVTGVNAGTYNYLIEPAVTLAASTTSLSYAQQSLTLSGTVTATYPDGSVAPLASQPVAITSYSGTWSKTTDASGNFSVTVTPNMIVFSNTELENIFWANVSGSDLESANSANVTVTGQFSPVQLSATLSSSYASYGQPVTLAGVAQYELGGVWYPLATATVTVTGTYLSNASVPGTLTAITDSSGKYSVQLPAQASAIWTASLASNQYLLFSSYSGYAGANSATLAVRLPTQLTSVRARYTPFGDITVTACLGLPAGVNGGGQVPDANNLSVQYASRPTGPWQTISSENDPSAAPTCRDGQPVAWLAYSGHLSGYYRIRDAGDYLYEPSASVAVRALTVLTRVTDFAVRPHSVSGHGRITFTGLIQQKTAGWHGLGHVRLYLLVQPPGYKTWAGYYKIVKTSASGRFSVSFADPGSAHWAMYYAGDSGHLASLSKTIYVAASGTSAFSRVAISNLKSSGFSRLRLPLPALVHIVG